MSDDEDLEYLTKEQYNPNEDSDEGNDADAEYDTDDIPEEAEDEAEDEGINNLPADVAGGDGAIERPQEIEQLEEEKRDADNAAQRSQETDHGQQEVLDETVDERNVEEDRDEEKHVEEDQVADVNEEVPDVTVDERNVEEDRNEEKHVEEDQVADVNEEVPDEAVDERNVEEDRNEEKHVEEDQVADVNEEVLDQAVDGSNVEGDHVVEDRDEDAATHGSQDTQVKDVSEASDDYYRSLTDEEDEETSTQRSQATTERSKKDSEAASTAGSALVQEEIVEELRSEDFISQVYLSADCTLPANILVYDHSFAYDCGRHFNLCVADTETLVYASGNLIHFFNINTRVVWCRRSAGGGGIGHIVKHPHLPHLAVGEKGNNPLLIIYEWPSLDIVCVLRDGTLKSYSHLDYSPDGSLLCSQGDDPDYMLTIWDWEKSKIILRRKAYGQKVINAMFSPFVAGQLATSGAGHIKFWKMVETFTGLKLLGDLGRFGKTEMCDIIGMMPLPDEKVISGTSWGNLLLWDEGLIKVEVMRRNRLTCHKGAVTQMTYDRAKNELTTVGMDGLVQLWFFGTIEQADPPQHDRVLETQPFLEFKIGEQGMLAALMCLHPLDHADHDNNAWVAQDANGGVWMFEIDRDIVSESEKILSCHSGGVMDLAVSPSEQYIASLGKGGRLHFYDYKSKTLLIRKRYPAGGCCFIWVPVNANSVDSVVIAGFSDGTMRVIVASLAERVKFGSDGGEFLTLIQVIKPHGKPVTAICINGNGTIVASGSEDATLFLHAVVRKGDYVALSPIGFVRLPGVASFVTWRPDSSATVLVCCHNGLLVEMDCPKRSQLYSSTSYVLSNVPSRTIRFKSVKSQIRRDIKLAEIQTRKDKKLELKKIDFEKLKADNPGLDFDEETFLEDSEEEEELEPLHVPEVPNRVLFAIYTDAGTLWLSMGGYDAGYIYEYDFKHEGPLSATLVPDADDLPIHTFVYSHDRKYLLLGMEDGKVRVNRVNPRDFRDLKDYWLLAMHDNDNGVIRRISFSYDQRFVFTGGIDGNIFSYQFNPEHAHFNVLPKAGGLSKGAPRHAVDDIEEKKTVLSYEETKMKQMENRKLKAANQHKEEVEKALCAMKEDFEAVRMRNHNLPSTQELPPSTFEIDPRITSDLQEKLQAEMDLTKRKTLFQLEKSNLGLKKVKDYFINVLEGVDVVVLGIDAEVSVSAFRHRSLTREYRDALAEVLVRIAGADKREREQQRKLSMARLVDPVRPVKAAESFLVGLNMDAPEFKNDIKLNRLLERYRARRNKRDEREVLWDEHRRNEPDPDHNDDDDVNAFREAKHSVGDFKLKASKDYRVPRHLRISTIKKYNELLAARQRLFTMQDEFNRRVLGMRRKKEELMEHVKRQNKRLAEIREEIGAERSRPLHPVPRIKPGVEYAELEYQVSEDDILYEMATKTDVDLWKVVLQETKKRVHVARNFAPSYEALMHEESTPGDLVPAVSSIESLQCLSAEKFKAVSQVSIRELEELAEVNAKDTLYERELKQIHLGEVLFQQEEITRDVSRKIREFDEQLKELHDLKLSTEVDVMFLDIFILQLDQELIILKVFESREDFLSEEVHHRFIADEDMMITINSYNREMDVRNKEIYRLAEKQKVITTSFLKAVAGNKFAAHLKKIFKKKYRPPKVESENSDESASEEDSTTEDEDRKSVDSHEFGALQLDETIRPEGCDKEIFDLTFTMRAERHQLELESGDHKKHVEFIKKDCEVAQRKKKVLRAALHKSQEMLDEFQREKQKKLNEVDVVVILKLSKLRHFSSKDRMALLVDTLVFSGSRLTELFNRPMELIEQRIEQRAKHLKHRSRFHQLKVECGHMDSDVKSLRKKIIDCKTKKFGGVVDLNYLEEALMRRMISRLKSTDEYRRDQEKQVLAMKNMKRDLRDTMCCVVRDNTEKTNVLIVLEADTHKLNLALHQQEVKKAANHRAHSYKDDCKTLKALLREQLVQAEGLRREMDKLSRKTKLKQKVAGKTSTDHAVSIRVTTIGAEIVTDDDDDDDDEDFESYTEPEQPPRVSITQFVLHIVDELLAMLPELPTTSSLELATHSPESSAHSLRKACSQIVGGLVEAIEAGRDDAMETSSAPDVDEEKAVHDLIQNILDCVPIEERSISADTIRNVRERIVDTIVDSLDEGKQRIGSSPGQSAASVQMGPSPGPSAASVHAEDGKQGMGGSPGPSIASMQVGEGNSVSEIIGEIFERLQYQDESEEEKTGEE